MLENSFYTNNNVDKQVFNATSNGAYVVGQAALGGIVAYILQPGDPGYDASLQQGYVATVADISTSTTWGCSGTLITGADGTALGSGNQNTIDIMAGCPTAGIAARLCGDLVQGGYSDWYLPSKDELNTLYLNRVAIGGFGVAYWSSSEVNIDNAWTQNFTNGAQGGAGKSSSARVRAIRSFSVPVMPPTPWQTWSKPEGRSMAYIVCIGGGGAGGGGFSGSSAVIRGGGGGGGSSAITIAQVPFYSIPDTLYIQVGLGGAGGTLGAGGSGGRSYVSCYPTTDMFNCLVVNSLLGAGGGGGGGTNAGGVGGAAGAVLNTSATNNPRYLSLCNWISYAGSAGSAGGANTNGAAITLFNTSIITAGTGGGAATTVANQLGGQLTSSDTLTSFIKTQQGGIAGTGSANAGNGNAGYSYLKPFLFCGGTGGGSAVTFNGGNGANGNIGSGGGGGGGGITGGNGGNGGNGLVMIISY